MIYWELLSYIAWVIAGLLLLWIMVDVFSVSRQVDEEEFIGSPDSDDDRMGEIKQEGEEG
ncbi:hypothetical protein [Methylophaga sp.]|uniref:hypothetical protein n=1 Tax=Methylophaga sp. TaxID=2024840 RepID=UPI003F69B79A